MKTLSTVLAAAAARRRARSSAPLGVAPADWSSRFESCPAAAGDDNATQQGGYRSTRQQHAVQRRGTLLNLTIRAASFIRGDHYRPSTYILLKTRRNSRCFKNGDLYRSFFFFFFFFLIKCLHNRAGSHPHATQLFFVSFIFIRRTRAHVYINEARAKQDGTSRDTITTTV
uniref:Secreted protein n=1 Tax=Trichogramma kaykai TaxID=54128 RepID=A0ABD2VYL2_9HYME